jgi:hypothetical protein
MDEGGQPRLLILGFGFSDQGLEVDGQLLNPLKAAAEPEGGPTLNSQGMHQLMAEDGFDLGNSQPGQQVDSKQERGFAPTLPNSA